MIWGRVEMAKDGEAQFKLVYTELEFEYDKVPEKDLMNYQYFVETKYKPKTETEIPDEEIRNKINLELKYFISLKLKANSFLIEKNLFIY